MRNSEPLSVNKLFKTSSLESIQERSVALSTLNALIYRFLPPILHTHCRVANYRQSILIIEVSSASWLTRLRYEQQNLILLLRQNGLIGLASLQYKINPELNPNKCILHCDNTDPPKREITPNSAACLLQLAENASPTLKSSLIKLANHVRKIDNNDV